MDRAAVIEFLAALSDAEFQQIVAEVVEARGGASLDIKALILRELEASA